MGGAEDAGMATEGTTAGLTWTDGLILGLGIGVVRTAARGVTEFEADITLPLPRAAAAAKNALACAFPLPLPPGLAPRPLAPAGLDVAVNFGEPPGVAVRLAGAGADVETGVTILGESDLAFV